MIVQIQGQQGADIQPEDKVRCYMLRQHGRIQAVKPLHNDNGVGMQPKLMSPPFPQSGLEIEGRQLHFFSCQQLRHILPEQLRINGIDMLQIQLPIRAGSDLIPVDIVVIQAHQDGLFSVNPQLSGQPVGGGRLAGGTGPRQHDCPGPPLTDHIRYLRIPLFVECLIHPDQLPDPAGGGQVIQICHCLALHQTAPPLSLIEYAEEIGHSRHLGTHRRILRIRIHKHKTAVSAEDIPHSQISGGRHHFSVVIVGKITVGIFIEIIRLPPTQEPGLIHLSFPRIAVNRLPQRYPPSEQRNILPHQLGNLLFQSIRGKVFRAGHRDEHTFSQGAVHFRHRHGTQLPQSQENGKLSRTDIGFLTLGITIPQQPHLSTGSRHGTAHGGTLQTIVLFPHGDVVQCKNLTGNFGRNRPLWKLFLL